MNPSSHPASGVHLPGLIAFEAVARHLRFSRAAAELQVSPTAMSKTINQLERRLSMRLFNRTTRSVQLTEAGQQLLQSLAPALEQIRGAVLSIAEATGKPSGLLRINTSHVGYGRVIEPHLPAFLEQYPQIIVDVALDNGFSDIVGAGFDVGLRLGHALHNDMIAVPVGGPQQLIVVGAPAYLQRFGTPAALVDLLQHRCIRQRLVSSSRLLDWDFSVAGRHTRIEVNGGLIVDEMQAALSAALRGHGLAYVFASLAAGPIAAGALVPLFERCSPDSEIFHLYYPNRAQMPGKLRAFIDFIQAANRAT
ncbi:LysR family transcriptional regulator [Pseudomonas gingeri]